MELNESEVRAMLKQAVNDAGSQKIFAYRIYVTEPYLSDVLNERRPLGAKILNELKLEAVITTVYRVKNNGED